MHYEKQIGTLRKEVSKLRNELDQLYKVVAIVSFLLLVSIILGWVMGW